MKWLSLTEETVLACISPLILFPEDFDELKSGAVFPVVPDIGLLDGTFGTYFTAGDPRGRIKEQPMRVSLASGDFITLPEAPSGQSSHLTVCGSRSMQSSSSFYLFGKIVI